MRRAQRLRERRDFAAVYRRGRPYRSDLLIVRTVSTGRSVSRFGFTTAKALGNAVVRNRLKRRLRESVRSLSVAPGWDVVVNARLGAPAAAYGRLHAHMGRLLARAGVLEKPEEESEG